MAGVSIWPMDKGFDYDLGKLDFENLERCNACAFSLDCILIQGFQ